MDDLLQTTLPISGLSPIVGDGQDPDLISRLKIDDVKREARHRTSSHRNICRDARHQRTSVREQHDLIDRGVNGVEELDAEVLPMVLRTIDPRDGIPRLLLLRTERAASPTTEFSLGALSDVFPEDAGRFASHDAARSPLDFSRLRGFNFSRILCFGRVQTGQ